MRQWVGNTLAIGVAAAALAVGSLVVSAQERGERPERRPGMRDAGQRDRGDRGDRPRFDPERMREMMVERLQEPLGATDEEWQAIKPLVADVMEKQAAARTSRFRMMGRGMRGRMGPRGGDRDDSQREDRRPRFGPEDPEADALEQTLENENAPAAEIEAKLKALREARKKKEQELQNAREKLRQVLTVRQEATLVLMGMLD